MKRLLLPLLLIALLGGCVAVPYDAYNTYPYAYPPGYVMQPPYAAPQPVYVNPPVYVGPPVYFGFGLNYSHGYRPGGWRQRGWGHGGHFRH